MPVRQTGVTAGIARGLRPCGILGRMSEEIPDWERLLAAERHLPDAVLVGGTAAALHAGHRVSLGEHLDPYPDVPEPNDDLA